jgi:hypothetical protein
MRRAYEDPHAAATQSIRQIQELRPSRRVSAARASAPAAYPSPRFTDTASSATDRHHPASADWNIGLALMTITLAAFTSNTRGFRPTANQSPSAVVGRS